MKIVKLRDGMYLKGFSLVKHTYKRTGIREEAIKVSPEMANRLVAALKGTEECKHATVEDA